MSNVMFTRRDFALCLGATALPLPAATEGAPWNGPANVHKVYLATPKPTWPYPDLDFKQEIAGIDKRLADLEAKHPGVVRFTGGRLLLNDADVVVDSEHRRRRRHPGDGSQHQHRASI